MVLIEAKLKSWGRAETVIKIIDQEMVKAEFEMCNLEDVIEAVRNCGDFRSSLVYLQQECQICFGFFPMNKITSLNICPCKICLYCMKQHFAICVNDRNVRKWTCPVCALPNMGDPDVAQEYLSFLKLLVSNLCEQNIQDKFDKKATDWQIQQEPNFRWCAHCEFGFIFPGSPSRLCMKCDNCKNKTCFNCKKKWEDAHDGISCEEFEQWKIDNDPTNQALGLAKHLEENGIECPECKMRFALAKGGCMHFICPQCSYEFCSGCNKPFFHENCPERCKLGNGLHCHHPRDCFFYLRDEDCVFLQELLVLHEKKFNKDDINNLTTCPVMEQKETTTSNYDEACGKEVKEGWAGLCLIHYKEYLVGLVNKHSLDPLDVMKSEDAIKTICRRLGIAVEKKENEGRGAYIKRLKRNICEKEPLHGRIEKGSPPSVN